MEKAPADSTEQMKWFYRFIPKSWYIRIRAVRTKIKSRRRGERELHIMELLVPPNRVAVDVGANRGVFTYYFSKYASRVIAYEANPVLANFIRSAGLTNVEVREKAVADKSGKMTFSIPIDPDGSPRINCGQIGSVDQDSEEFEVESVRLDDEDVGDVGFIKADVEGHEVEVLKGAKQTLARYKPIVLLEILTLKNAEPDMEVVNLMESYGYSCFFYDGRNILPLERAKIDSIGRNFLFFPNSYSSDVPEA